MEDKIEKQGDYNKIFDEPEAPIVKDGEIHVSPWIETNRKETLVGVKVGMSFETFGRFLKKLKFW